MDRNLMLACIAVVALNALIVAPPAAQPRLNGLIVREEPHLPHRDLAYSSVHGAAVYHVSGAVSPSVSPMPDWLPRSPLTY